MEELIKLYFPDDINIGSDTIQNFALTIYKELQKKTKWTPRHNTSSPSSTQESAFLESPYSPSTTQVSQPSPSSSFKPKRVEQSQILINGKYEDVSITKLLLKRDGNNYIKKYLFFEDNYTYLSILREIVLHYYAIYLVENQKCETTIIIPKLIMIEEGKEEEYISLSITMDYLDLIDLTSDDETKLQILENWESYNIQIQSLLSCFETNFLYHNDTHRDNLTIVRVSGEPLPRLALFDFGKSTLKRGLQETSTGYLKGTEMNRKEFEKWLYRIKEPDSMMDTRQRYGGKSNKNKTRTKSKRSNKKLSRKRKTRLRKSWRTK